LRIIVPRLTPTIFLVRIASMTGTFQTFGLLCGMTNGDPVNSSNVSICRLWQPVCGNAKMGYASATAWLPGSDHLCRPHDAGPVREHLGALLRSRATDHARGDPSYGPPGHARAARSVGAGGPGSFGVDGGYLFRDRMRSVAIPPTWWCPRNRPLLRIGIGSRSPAASFS